MFKNLLELSKEELLQCQNNDCTVEELIDAPYFTIKINDTITVYKTNKQKITEQDIILNSIYKDILDFADSLSKLCNSYMCELGFFYFPCVVPRSIAYPQYANKFMLSYNPNKISIDVLRQYNDNILPNSPTYGKVTLTDDIICAIDDCTNNKITNLELAEKILNNIPYNIIERTKTEDIEGLLINIDNKKYKLTINTPTEDNNIAEKKMCRDIIMKDFANLYDQEQWPIINDSYDNIICDLFIKYISISDILNKYDFSYEDMKPPMIGYVGEMAYDYIEDERVVEILKNNEYMKGLFKIIFNGLRKPLVKKDGDILTDIDISEINHIVHRIKNETV